MLQNEGYQTHAYLNHNPSSPRQEGHQITFIAYIQIQDNIGAVAKLSRSGRIGAILPKSRSCAMPTYMSVDWPDRKLRFKTRPVGFRRLLRIPRLLDFPYFSGTMFELELQIHNDSEVSQDIQYAGQLFRLSGTTHQTADHIKQDEGHVQLDRNSKTKRRLHLAHLPQPGNYSFELHLGSKVDESWKHGQGHAVYFDALPKDATSFNAGIVIIASIISLIIGLIVGGLSAG